MKRREKADSIRRSHHSILTAFSEVGNQSQNFPPLPDSSKTSMPGPRLFANLEYTRKERNTFVLAACIGIDRVATLCRTRHFAAGPRTGFESIDSSDKYEGEQHSRRKMPKS